MTLHGSAEARYVRVGDRIEDADDPRGYLEVVGAARRKDTVFLRVRAAGGYEEVLVFGADRQVGLVVDVPFGFTVSIQEVHRFQDAAAGGWAA